MGIRNAYDVRHTPKGLSDSSDGTDVFPGACQKLINLVFSQSDPELVLARPGNPVATDFPGFISAGAISVAVPMGKYIIGMIGSGLNPGKDQPFVYDTEGGVFMPITGITAPNTPDTQSTAGAWEPPTIAVVGHYALFTHPGFAATASFFGWLDIATIAAPVWNSGNTAMGLPARPTSVANFNARAYYAIGNPTPNLVYYSNVLDPLLLTALTQAITVGDPSPITGQAGLPITTATAGVTGALLIFKASQIWQVTGDASVTTNPLGLNYLSLTLGTAAPRTIYPAPDGTYFMGPDCVYVVTPLATVMPLKRGDNSGNMTPDIQIPFQNATTPSRACAAYNSGIYRICLDTIIRSGEALIAADYWFDTHPRRWNGPHTFGYHVVVPMGKVFYIANNLLPGLLFRSEVYPSITSVYQDNSLPYQVQELTCMLPKQKGLSQKQVTESSIELSSPGVSATYLINAVDETGASLGSASINTTSTASQWGSVNWGSFTWGSSAQVPGVYTIPWTAPVNFQKMGLQVIATAVNGLMIGTNYFGYQTLGYRNSRLPNM